MGLKLLNKQDVMAHKAIERKRDIDEGLKLARRIDALRETQAEEEASLEKFRNETLKTIHAEISREHEALAQLKVEVKLLREARAQAVRPIEEDMACLKEAQDAMTKDLDALNAFRKELTEKERVVDEMAKDTERENARIKSIKQTHEFLLEDANRNRVATEKALEDARKLRDQNANEADRLERNKKAFEKDKENTEKRHAMRDKEQDERERELNARETRLNDRETMNKRLSLKNKK